jgi:AAA domain
MSHPEIDAMKDQHRTGSASPCRFKLQPFAEIGRQIGAPYLIKDMIPREGLVVVWGAPKCGKSFLICDALLHVALGWEYRGRRVAQGVVVYVCLEGERGISSRIEAFRRRRLGDSEPSDVPFYVVTTRLDMASDHSQLITEIQAQLGKADPVMAIVIDTLNRSLAGSESSDEDMGAYVRACDAVREAFGCAVIVVHHCGHEATRPRGHTSLLGAADAQIAVKRDTDDNIVAIVEYMKDGAAGAETISRLVVVELGQDEDGDPISSCVVEPVDGAAPRPHRRPKSLAPALKLALDKFDDLMAREGKPPPPSEHIPERVPVISLDAWRKHLRATGAIPEDGAAQRKGWQRAREGLIEAGLIGQYEGWLWRISDIVTRRDKP